MTLRDGETLDPIVYPDLRVIQPVRGYRFSLDPVLLCSFLETRPPGPVIDLGCGSGVLALLLARRWPGLPVVGLELQAALADRAGRGVRMNGLGERVLIVRGDLRSCRRLLKPACAGTVVANPPYRKPGDGRLSPDPERAAARHEILMSLDDLTAAIGHLLLPEGEFFLTWKPERLGELRNSLAREGLGVSHVRPVRSRAGMSPFLLLCRGSRSPRGAAEPLNMPPLDIYSGRDYTPEAAAMLGAPARPSSLVFSAGNP